MLFSLSLLPSDHVGVERCKAVPKSQVEGLWFQKVSKMVSRFKVTECFSVKIRLLLTLLHCVRACVCAHGGIVCATWRLPSTATTGSWSLVGPTQLPALVAHQPIIGYAGGGGGGGYTNRVRNLVYCRPLRIPKKPLNLPAPFLFKPLDPPPCAPPPPPLKGAFWLNLIPTTTSCMVGWKHVK